MPQSPVTASRRAGRPVLVLTGGGSGGHITPLLSLAHELKRSEPNCQIVYVGHKGDKFDSLKMRFGSFDYAVFINAGKFRRYHGRSFWERTSDAKTLPLNTRDFFKLFSSTIAAYRLLRRFAPDVVFSKGGFVALPVGIAAKIRRVPVITHDSDAQPGLANRIIGRWAVVHATAMPPNLYAYPKNTIRWVGVPVDERIHRVDSAAQNKYKREIGLDSSDFVLLISGGGLGSRNINDKILSIAPELLKYPRLKIVHIAGEKGEKTVRSGYKNMLAEADTRRVIVIGFSGDFYKYVAAADLIVGRAGATSLAEFAAAAKACIIIPSPFLSGGHQLKNAEQLKKQGAIEIVDNEAPPKELQLKIGELIDDNKKRLDLGSKLAATSKADASKELAKILLGIGQGRT